jgi:hypothetical protein
VTSGPRGYRREIGVENMIYGNVYNMVDDNFLDNVLHTFLGNDFDVFLCGGFCQSKRAPRTRGR